MGMGTWRKAPKLFLPSEMEVKFWFGFFPMPPIPIVLKHSFLFHLACTITLAEKSYKFGWYETFEGGIGRGRKEGQGAVGMGT